MARTKHWSNKRNKKRRKKYQYLRVQSSERLHAREQLSRSVASCLNPVLLQENSASRIKTSENAHHSTIAPVTFNEVNMNLDIEDANICNVMSHLEEIQSLRTDAHSSSMNSRFHPYKKSRTRQQSRFCVASRSDPEPVSKSSESRIETNDQASLFIAGAVVEHEIKSADEAQTCSSDLHIMKKVKITKAYERLGFEFDAEMENLKWNSCENCHRAFPGLRRNSSGNCIICSPPRLSGMLDEVKEKHLHKFTSYNNMDPGHVPDVLKGLTYIEQMLIALVHPVISLYKINGQQFAYHGNVINFHQDIIPVIRKLPDLAAASQAIILICKETPKGFSHFKVRSKRVREAISWLIHNNKYYQNIELDEKAVDSLPEDGDAIAILSFFPTFLSENYEKISDPRNQNEAIENFTQSFFPSIPIRNQDQSIRNLCCDLQWPAQNVNPINEFREEGYIVKAFPTLFPYGDADFLQPRPIKVHLTEYFKFLLQFHDGRFARDPRFRFLAMNTEMRLQALKQGDIFVKKSALQNISRQKFQELILKDNSLANSVMFYASKLRTSKSFWYQRSGELLDMVNQIGTPTVFFTLSAADYHWPHLFKLLTMKPPNDLTDKERADLMHQNPLITAFFFTKRAESFLNKVIKKVWKVKDHWFRYEWQWRGSPHLHGLLWLENAPDFQSLDNVSDKVKDEFLTYCSDICSAFNPDQHLPPASQHPSRRTFSEAQADSSDLPQLLNTFQRHTRCGDHCLRKNKGTVTYKCRFKFPQEQLKKSRFVKDSNVWIFQPARNDELLQRYNPLFTRIWRGNTDFTPIIDKLAVLNYIAKYASKAEHKSPAYSDVLNEIAANNHDSEPKKIIKKLMLTSTSERDYSAQEVAHFLMGWPLYRSSRTFITITIKDEEWISMIRPDANNQAAIITRYKNREPELEDISLFQFAKNYHYIKGANVFKANDKVVRVFPRFKQTHQLAEDEKFFKMLAILHLPWKYDYDNLLSGIPQTRYPWFHLCQQYELFRNYFQDFPEDDDNFIFEEWENPQKIHEEAYMAISRVGPNYNNQDALGRRQIDSAFEWENLNAEEQETAKIVSWLQVEKSRYTPDEQKIMNEQQNLSVDQQKVMDIFLDQVNCIHQGIIPSVKRVMVQGKAGCGKSFLIGMMKQYATEKLGRDSIELLAPTGVAAVNISGKTLHSFLKISKSSYTPLAGETQRRFQNIIKKRKFLIFDEMSMIGLQLLNKIDLRLKEGIGSGNESFGGLVIYFFGDIRQLPPVLDKPIYNPHPSNDDQSFGKLAIDSFEKYLQLTTNHRQSDGNEALFREILDSIAKYHLSIDQWKMLLTRRMAVQPQKELDRFKKSIRLFPTRERVEEYNKDCLGSSGHPVAFIPARHNNRCASKAPDEVDQQLPETLYLSIGCRVMLRKNIWTEVGLVNGSLGTVKNIIYNNSRPPTLPECVLIEFDNYKGPFFKDNLVPIVPITRTWKDMDIECSRSQLPLSLAHAITIHKSQGLTLPQAVVDFGEKEVVPGLIYVGLSRVKKMNNLMLETCADFTNFLRSTKNVLYREEFLRKFY